MTKRSPRWSSALQLREHVDDRGLYGDVERGRDFVADEELWLGDERAGDRHALTLSARQLVWVTLEARRRELHPLEGCPDSSATVGSARGEEVTQGLLDDLRDLFRGFSELYGLWNTYWISRRMFASRARAPGGSGRPRNDISPV